MANPCSMFDLQDVARVFYPPPPAEATALAASADRYEPLSVGAALHRNVRGPPSTSLSSRGRALDTPYGDFQGLIRSQVLVIERVSHLPVETSR